MEVDENSYKGCEDPSYTKFTKKEATCDDYIRNTRGRAASQKINPDIFFLLLSLGLATEVPKLTHYWVVWFHPRASTKVTSRLCPFIVLGAT